MTHSWFDHPLCCQCHDPITGRACNDGVSLEVWCEVCWERKASIEADIAAEDAAYARDNAAYEAELAKGSGYV